MKQDDRIKVLNLLANFQPSDEKENHDVLKIKELIVEHENIFSRSCLEGHLTASALVVNSQTKMVLLHKHRKLNMWLQFGGHADGDSDMAFVAIKEAREETGLSDLKFLIRDGQTEILPIDIDLQTIPEMEETPEHYHLDFRFILLTNATEIPKPNEEESQDLKFFSFAEIEAMDDKLDFALRRLARKTERLMSYKKDNSNRTNR
jgi:8-oxo-dGTP pyrophosphatase MutT (NUDIX family)